MVRGESTFRDPEAQKLAQDINEAQKREIAQLQEMLARLQS